VQDLGPFDGFCLVDGQPMLCYDRGSTALTLHFSASGDLLSHGWVPAIATVERW
jgi:hypothetical protein